MSQARQAAFGWILLVHQLPAHPSNLRVRIWRKIQQMGAVAVKNSVYVLPDTDANREIFLWLAQEVKDAGGDASLFRSHTLVDLTDRQIISEFQEARSAEYAEVIKNLRKLDHDLRSIGHSFSPQVDSLSHTRNLLKSSVSRLEHIRKIDFFGAPNQREALRLAESCRVRLKHLSDFSRGAGHRAASTRDPILDRSQFQKKVWATRPGLHIDRLGSAWLIQRHIDPKAAFRFMKETKNLPKGAIPFDMTGMIFGHHREECSFETFLRRFGLKDPPLRAIGEMIHDVDLKDEKYGRPETAGLEAIINGLIATVINDRRLIEACRVVFDALFDHLKRNNKPAKEIGA